MRLKRLEVVQMLGERDVIPLHRSGLFSLPQQKMSDIFGSSGINLSSRLLTNDLLIHPTVQPPDALKQ